MDGKVVKAHEKVQLSKVILIDSIELSRNDRRLRVRAIDGDYVFNMNGALNVMDDMLSDFGFWRADNSNLINMAHVDKVVDALFKPEVLFVNTDIRGQIAAIKVRALRKLFPEILIVKK
ncbi:LytTR family transcriptional regulator DNA-binding domain-containing protein [Paenibacillus planticolens]|uniref:LytTR family transcriptional regulator DNA-binding domain-containing protein n=1 Tax=Paenibacillus planticolens TaxID=2654976 RepID=UPI001491DDDA|nr:LytTR family transcriptional regulator DNA-binding domain-containing protein [Paenibacillus planticolens]